MATRNDVQIAQDLIRFVNIMNDLLDRASYILREINPETGEKHQVRIPETDPPEFRDATLDELKQTAKRTGQNVLGYRNMLQSFITRYGGKDIRKILLSINVSYDDILADITVMENVARNLNNNAESCNTKAELISMAEQIDQNVPKLILVRRSWCLGI